MMNWYFASGDLDFFWKEQMQSLSWLPQVFHAEKGFGLHGLLSLWLDYPFRLLLKLLYSVGLSWFVIEKLLWISVFALAIYSSKKLAEYVLGKGVFSWVSPVIYTTNTYMLLLFGGGQLGVALAYGFAPLVLLKFIQAVDELPFGFASVSLSVNAQGRRVAGYGLKQGIRNGLLLALLITFDLRLAYLVLGAVALYYGLMIVDERLRRVSIVYHLSLIFNLFVIPLIVAGFVHTFWILPVLLAGGSTAGLGEELTSPGMLKFLSVADFSHALSLLHPNWPENLFGKVYFLQPEFLVIPLLAFAAITWKGQETINNRLEEGQETINNRLEEGQETISNKLEEGQEAINNRLEEGQETINNKQNSLLLTAYCPFFVLLSLVGAFFAKGVNEPFGGIYAWMFTHVPGFVMFRDPTKFYLFVALGYSILVPYTFYCLSHALKNFRYKQFIVYCLLTVFVFYWFFTLRAVFTGQVAGNFRPTQLPQEYVQLKDLLVADRTPSRTLWIPQRENYAFFSDMHPVLATDSAFVVDPLFVQKISQMGVRYVIVPIDVNKRLFLTDYHYDPSQREALVEALGKTSLKQNLAFGDIAVFENDQFVFEQTTPAVVAKQQKLANIGMVISIISLGFFGAMFIVVKRDNKQ